jgi:hypothetical protein
MASTWTNLQIQTRKIRGAVERLTPPIPDDEFEGQRKHTIDALKKQEDYVSSAIEQHEMDERREAADA